MDTIIPVLKLDSTKYCSGVQVTSGEASDDLLEYTLTQTNNSVSGSTILYCIDTTNTCTPNEKYTGKIYSKNNGNYYFKYQITSGAGKSSSGSYRAIVNDTTYCAVNLIKNGSFEDQLNLWTTSYVSISSDAYSGKYSLQFGKNTTDNDDVIAMSYQSLMLDNPELNHMYYASLMFKSSSSFNTRDNRFEWYAGEVDGASTLIFARKDIKANTWTRLSAIKTITTSEYLLSKKWIIRNFQRGANEYSYSDDLILIDLTDTFGAGNEPSKEWCDANLVWHEGKKIIYK